MLKLISLWIEQIPSLNYLQPYIGNPYLISALIVLVFMLLAKVALFAFSMYLKKIAKKTKTKFDDIIFGLTRRPLFHFVFVFGIWLALVNLAIENYLLSITNSLLVIIFILILSRTVDAIIQTWGDSFAKKTKTKVDEVLLPLFHKATRVIFFIVALMWVLSIWQINLTPYLAGVGVGGLIIGLAFQDALKNIFGGITLVLDKTFYKGDKVKLESGEVGTIYDVGLRSTKLVTYDNEVIYIPNGYLANSRIQNFTRPDPRIRVVVDFGVEYGTNPEKVKKVVLETLKKLKDTLEEPKAVVEFVEMADFALKFKAKFWVEKWSEAYNKKLEATEKIYQSLNKAKIGIPFPTQTLYVKKKK